MISEKDFKFVGISYVDPKISDDPAYTRTQKRFLMFRCNLSQLKTRWQRFFAPLRYAGVAELKSKRFTDKVIKLTCPKDKLISLSNENLRLLKCRIVDWLSERYPNVKDVYIYALERN